MFIQLQLTYECLECESKATPTQFNRVAECGHRETGLKCTKCGHEYINEPPITTTTPYPNINPVPGISVTAGLTYTATASTTKY